MDCADAKLRMEPCASGALVPEELALFEEHIATCEGCRLELELVRAMGSSKPGDGKPDDWTLDRIFGSDPAKASEGPRAAEISAAPAESPAETNAESPAAPAPEAESLAIAPMTAGFDPSPSAATVESEPSDAGTLFETTPNPMPPESPAPSAPSLFSEPSAPSLFSEPGAAPPVSVEAPIADHTMFDEPNAVSALSAEAPSAPLAPSAPPEPPVSKSNDAPAPAPKPTPARPAPASRAADSGDSWDFEPADAKPEASLPEGSLFFAEETLARQGDARKGKSALKRMVIWGGGALVGVALLALSLWIGFFARVEGTDQNAGSPGASTGQPAPSGGEAPESLATSGEGAMDSSTAVTPDVVTTPADEVVAPTAGSGTTSGAPKPLGARALSGGGVPPPSTSTRTGSQPVAPRSTSGVPAATSGKGEPKKPAVATTPGGSAKAAPNSSGTPKPSEDATSTAPDSRVLVIEEPDPEQLLLRAPAPAPTPSEQSVPFSGQAATPRKPAVASPPLSVAPVPAEPGSAAPAADSVQRPIDRLHLATVAAEQGSDLVALRKVRDTWKGFVRTSVGPDRARAKRELADCLWAIQFLTGRTSDKKAALAAYREYLLNAPAGGADPRTVARMRQLEDALAESK